MPGRTHAHWHRSGAVLGLAVGGEDRSFDATAVVEQPRNGAGYPHSIRPQRLQCPPKQRPRCPLSAAQGSPPNPQLEEGHAFAHCPHYWHPLTTTTATTATDTHPPCRIPAAPSAALIRPHRNLGQRHPPSHRNPLPPLCVPVLCHACRSLAACLFTWLHLRRQAETKRARNPSCTVLGFASGCAWRNF